MRRTPQPSFCIQHGNSSTAVFPSLTQVYRPHRPRLPNFRQVLGCDKIRRRLSSPGAWAFVVMPEIHQHGNTTSRVQFPINWKTPTRKISLELCLDRILKNALKQATMIVRLNVPDRLSAATLSTPHIQYLCSPGSVSNCTG
jgi:hypothetical protein